MKKLINILITLGMLACGVGFWMAGGSQLMKILAGPQKFGAGETFGEAEGKYISYEAAYPVASCVEEYYSGDQDHVRRRGYVVYDEARQAFLYVVVPAENIGDLENLMWNLKQVSELRTEKDMAPVIVEGTLERMGAEDRRRVLGVLEESDVIEVYRDSQGEEAYIDAYVSDVHGRVMESMCENLDEILQQTDWYWVGQGVFGGREEVDVQICMLAACASLLIFVIRLLSLFVSGSDSGKKEELQVPSGSKMEQFYARQREWLEQWYEDSLEKGRRQAYWSVIISVVIFVAIGFRIKVSAEKLSAFYLPLGLVIGEVVGAMFWYSQKGQSKPGKILKKFAKNIGKVFPSAAAQEIFAEDIMETGSEWEFSEKTKDAMSQGIMGKRYWVVLRWNGLVTIVDSEKLGKIETGNESGTVHSGKVHVRYRSYDVRFYYRSDKPKKFCDDALIFEIYDNEQHFMELARKRVGETVEIVEL